MENPFPLPVTQSRIPICWVAKDVAGLQVIMVNVYFISQTKEGQTSWFLIDAGMGNCAQRIKKAAEFLFGPDTRPEGILLTHGHFDHIGAVANLSKEWEVPVYAHAYEVPYLTGRSSYPPPDPTVGGGTLAAMAGLYPKKPIDISDRLMPLPSNGSIPGLEDWKFIHTPGHTPGHVSFFRESDKTLIAGDAFVTVKQESFFAVLKQQKEIHGPPAYFTCDWEAAERSVATLTMLKPEVAACGHGKPMRGKELHEQLAYLNKNFLRVAVPKHGRYVNHPAQTDASGVVEVPPTPAPSVARQIVAAGLAALAGYGLGVWGKKMLNDHRNKSSGIFRKIK